MIWENLFAVLAFITGLIYVILGLITSNYQDEDNDSDKGWVISPLWAFFPNSYNENGKKLCATGVRVLCVLALLSSIWLFIR